MKPLERKPDIDRVALESLLHRTFGRTTPITYGRTMDGVSTQVYRLHRGSEVFYVRVAEEENESLAVDAKLLGELRDRGVSVPEVVYVEPFAPVLRRSVEAPNGDFAAFCLAWLDRANRVGLLEPVGTHPEHRRLGLATAVCLGVLQSLARVGATHALVNSRSGSIATKLYESIGMHSIARNIPFVRRGARR